jgi:hypothetical protein
MKNIVVKRKRNQCKRSFLTTHFHVHVPEVGQSAGQFAYVLGSASFPLLGQEQKILSWRNNKQAVGG